MKKHQRPTTQSLRPARGSIATAPAQSPKSPTRVSDARGAAQQQSKTPAPAAPKVHLLLGPVGAGKSTYGLNLARTRRALRLTLDEWMAQLFSPDRPDDDLIAWYVERSGRCLDLIWGLTEQALDCQLDVVLELGLLLEQERHAFYAKLDEAEIAYAVYVLDAPRDTRRKRVEERNRAQGETFAMIVPPHIFELASDRWQPVQDRECIGREVHFVFCHDPD